MFDTSDPTVKETFNRISALEFSFRALAQTLEAQLPGLSAKAREQVLNDYETNIRPGNPDVIARRKHLAFELFVPWCQRCGSPARPVDLGVQFAAQPAKD